MSNFMNRISSFTPMFAAMRKFFLIPFTRIGLNLKDVQKPHKNSRYKNNNFIKKYGFIDCLVKKFI